MLDTRDSGSRKALDVREFFREEYPFGGLVLLLALGTKALVRVGYHVQTQRTFSEERQEPTYLNCGIAIKTIRALAVDQGPISIRSPSFMYAAFVRPGRFVATLCGGRQCSTLLCV